MFGARFAAGGGVFSLVLRQQHKSPIVWLRGWVCVKLHVRNNRLFNVMVPMWWIWGRIIAAEAVYCRCNVAEPVLLPPLRWRGGFCGRPVSSTWGGVIEAAFDRRKRNKDCLSLLRMQAAELGGSANLEAWMPDMRGQSWHSQNKLCFSWKDVFHDSQAPDHHPQRISVHRQTDIHRLIIQLKDFYFYILSLPLAR